jgi:hypothetical protein
MDRIKLPPQSGIECLDSVPADELKGVVRLVLDIQADDCEAGAVVPDGSAASAAVEIEESGAVSHRLRTSAAGRWQG